MYYGENESRKQSLSYKKYRTAQIRGSLMICLAGLLAGGIILPIVLFSLRWALSEFGTLLKDGSATVAIFLMLGIFISIMIVLQLICMLPLIWGVIRLVRVLKHYEIVLSEIELVKPFDKQKTERRHGHYEKVWYHAICFKDNAKYLTRKDPNKFNVGDKYYLEICGKDEIAEIFSFDKYELTR